MRLPRWVEGRARAPASSALRPAPSLLASTAVRVLARLPEAPGPRASVGLLRLGGLPRRRGVAVLRARLTLAVTRILLLGRGRMGRVLGAAVPDGSPVRTQCRWSSRGGRRRPGLRRAER